MHLRVTKAKEIDLVSKQGNHNDVILAINDLRLCMRHADDATPDTNLVGVELVEESLVGYLAQVVVVGVNLFSEYHRWRLQEREPPLHLSRHFLADVSAIEDSGYQYLQFRFILFLANKQARTTKTERGWILQQRGNLKQMLTPSAQKLARLCLIQNTLFPSATEIGLL